MPRSARQLLGFAGEDVRVEVELSGNGSARILRGRLLPGGNARIEIRHVDHTTTVAADERGHFAIPDLPPGAVSLRCHLDVPGRPRVLATPWLPI
jgi:hypothetical protein